MFFYIFKNTDYKIPVIFPKIQQITKAPLLIQQPGPLNAVGEVVITWQTILSLL